MSSFSYALFIAYMYGVWMFARLLLIVIFVNRNIVEVFSGVIFQSSQDGEVHSRRAPQDYGLETQYP